MPDDKKTIIKAEPGKPIYAEDFNTMQDVMLRLIESHQHFGEKTEIEQKYTQKGNETKSVTIPIKPMPWVAVGYIDGNGGSDDEGAIANPLGIAQKISQTEYYYDVFATPMLFKMTGTNPSITKITAEVKEINASKIKVKVSFAATNMLVTRWFISVALFRC